MTFLKPETWVEGYIFRLDLERFLELKNKIVAHTPTYTIVIQLWTYIQRPAYQSLFAFYTQTVVDASWP